MKSFFLVALFFCLALFFVAEAKKFVPAPDCLARSACVSSDWRVVQRAHESHVLRVVVPVTLKNIDKLQTLVYEEIANPLSPNYAKILSFDELGRMTLNQEAVDAIEAFFAENAIKSAKTPNSDYFIAMMNVSTAERVLDTEFHVFHSRASGQHIVRALHYNIPDELENHVNLFGDVISFPHTLRPAPLITAHSVEAAGTVTPSLINSVYKVNSNTVKNTGKATQSVFESGQDFAPKDLATFQTNYNLPQDPVATVIGTNTPLICSVDINTCVEANLDVQYMKAVAQGSDTTYWSVANSNDVFLSWITDVAAKSSPPLVHSISYGSVESESAPTELNQFDQEALKLGARGVTIMVSSGDDGVANYQARTDPSQCGFNPSFPASATNVLAVGATQGPENGKPEVVCSSKTGGVVTSGGGFSTVFAQPSYQTAAVSGYLSSGVKLPPASDYNGKGRGYPDVALVGHNYVIVVGGKSYDVSGTSCSSPTFAGLVTLVNDARISAGKNPVGLINKAIYTFAASNPEYFNDVTVGENNCCAADTNPVCCPNGFMATKGWDPTTGYGSVNFNSLLKAFVSLP